MPESKTYADFNTEDFIRDESFQRWILAPEPGSQGFWEEYLRLHAGQKESIDEAAAFIRLLKFASYEPSAAQTEASLTQQLNRIATDEGAQMQRDGGLRRARSRRMLIWSGAAMLAGMLWWVGFSVFFASAGRLSRATAAGDIRTVVLPDSSEVILNAHSELRWSRDFGKSHPREVWLTGEAYFRVKHASEGSMNAAPFIVHAQDLDIAVLGTQFNVTNGRGFTNVILDKGRIRVRLDDSSRNSRELAPGELLRYTAANHRIAVRKVMAELYTSWKNSKVTLNDVPMSKLAEMIQDVYGDSIVFKGSELSTYKVSGTLQVTDEDALLKTLAFVLDIQILRQGNVLVFTAK